jgi:hypothetical protein
MKRRTRWVVGIVVVIVTVVVVVLLVSERARDIAGVAGEGGEVELRDPLRSPRGGRRVLLIALDGVGDDELRRAVQAGHLPTVQALFGTQLDENVYEHAYAVPGALAILPSTTMAAWAAVFTGAPPAHTGVPGNEWYDREQMRFFAPGPVTVDDHAHVIAMYADDLLGRSIRVPTVFERLDLRAHVALMPVYRGADLLAVPSLADAAQAFGRMATGLVDDDPVDRDVYAALDEGSIDQVLESIRNHGLPDIQVVYFAGIDLYTHFAEPPLPQMHRYLHEVFDPALRRLIDAYAEHDALDDTYIVFVADHGHTPVLKDERHALGTDEDHDPPAVVARTGYRLRPFELEPDEHRRDYQAVLAYQGAFAYVYLADRATCVAPGERCDWRRPPRFEEDVLPLVHAFDSATREGTLVPELQGTIDLIFAREPRPIGAAQEPFRVWDGARLVAVREYLDTTPRPDLLDLEARLEALAVGPHGHLAGDILLMARSGMSRPIHDRFYFSSLYNSWHGSADASDSRIPIVVAHAGRQGMELKAEVDAVVGERPSQLHVTPLLEALLRP